MGVSTKSVSTFWAYLTYEWMSLNKQSDWSLQAEKKKPPSKNEGFSSEKSGFSSVGVEGFEPPTPCSQSRIKILYKWNFTSVSVVEVEPIITLQIESCGGYSQEMVLVLGQNLPIVQSYISSASYATRN